MKNVTPMTKMLEAKKMAKSMLFCAVGFLFFTIVTFLSFYISCQERKAIEGGVKVKADIVGIVREASDLFYERYEYTDKNGIKYSGQGKSFRSESEAESAIGSKIDIYIDSKGNSIAVGRTPNDRVTLVAGIVLLIITSLFIVQYVRLLNKYKKEKLLYIQSQENEIEEEHPGIEGGSFLQDLQKYNSNSDNK